MDDFWKEEASLELSWFSQYAEMMLPSKVAFISNAGWSVKYYPVQSKQLDFDCSAHNALIFFT